MTAGPAARRVSPTLLGALALCAAVLLTGCATVPPTGWDRGGSQLHIPRARWVYGSQTLELGQNGRVILSGNHWITIDRAGRAYDANNAPVALLRPDGLLMGPDDEPLGWVGAGETMQPGGRTRWLMFSPGGEVLRYEDGQQQSFGVWFGCNQVPYTLQACALVTHLLARSWWQLQNRNTRWSSPRGPGGFITPFP